MNGISRAGSIIKLKKLWTLWAIDNKTSVNPSSKIIVTSTSVKPVLSPLLTLFLLLFTIGQRSRFHYYSNFILLHSIIEESKAYMDKAIFPRPYSKEVMQLDHKPRFIWFQGLYF